MLRSLFIVALVSTLLTGCKSVPQCPAELSADARRALSEHDTQRAGWQTLKAEARVTQWADRGRIRGTVLMFLEQPARVRFDVMSQMGPAAVLTSDGETFQLTDQRAGTFLYGPTCPENIARLLGISMDAAAILRILTGDVPRIEAVAESVECRDGYQVVVLQAADGSIQELAFSLDEADRGAPPERQRFVLRRSVQRLPDGTKQWEASYDDYVDVGGQSFPTHVRFVDELRGADTSVRVKSISIDPEIPEGVFQQAPPPGMAVDYAACP